MECNTVHVHENCLLVSSLEIPEEVARGLESQVAHSLTRRFNVDSLESATHYKSYCAGDQGGDEHDIIWNFRSRRLSYRSTGWAVRRTRFNHRGRGNIAAFPHILAELPLQLVRKLVLRPWEFNSSKNRLAFQGDLIREHFTRRALRNQNVTKSKSWIYVERGITEF
ncbi:uncharacterized protein BDR25DRAFT_362980 [Lindgomyces ingoldianus]|uniref:Uncharacterized protein n=1 Tax=Lindgomyces ingoldianus TaxID=673940 RepID=A0ACB6Q9J2_9PLEO|nr:uncharacterized protein BDR25DRAFT_362980 [Lindgomyces ingoldianus]KAF2463253.1 hypothetical protein BDR25DRAFT_362980 [Lindgomyces ingoldianus]